MAQIFVSHSSRDADLNGFIHRAFATQSVRAVYEEIEKLAGVAIGSPRILEDIRGAAALFVMLSRNVQNLAHTRDWVVWETGVAASVNKDIWVFEPFEEYGEISVVIPHLTDYAVISPPTEGHLQYIINIIRSYDSSRVLPMIMTGAGAGMVAGRGAPGATLVGGLGGLVYAGLTENRRPAGSRHTCAQCGSSYNLHLPQGMTTFRCPVCNSWWELPQS